MYFEYSAFVLKPLRQTMFQFFYFLELADNILQGLNICILIVRILLIDVNHNVFIVVQQQHCFYFFNQAQQLIAIGDLTVSRVVRKLLLNEMHAYNFICRELHRESINNVGILIYDGLYIFFWYLHTLQKHADILIKGKHNFIQLDVQVFFNVKLIHYCC